MAGETNGTTNGHVAAEAAPQVVGQDNVVVDVDPEVSPELAQQAQSMVGKAPENKAERETLIETHNTYVKQQQQRQRQTNFVKKPVLEHAYPASHKPLGQLEKIFLKDLRVEKHHEGKVLILRTVTPPYQGTGTVVIAEDEHKDADKMGIYNQSDASIVSIIPEGSVIAVKEPYYKYNGQNDFMICVDHPSDIVYLKFDDDTIPEAFRLPDGETDTPKDWKDAGDKAFLARSLPIATLCYSRSIETFEDADKAFLLDVYSKRCNSNLMMRRFDMAKADADASLKGTAADSHAFHVAGRAAYGLGDFAQAKKFYKKSLEKKPGEPKVLADLEKCEQRIKEATEGIYDFPAMVRQITAKNIWVDVASFLGNTEVRDSTIHGRGLFATKDLKAGDLIFVEKALCCPNEFDMQHNSAALFANLVRACQDNETFHKKILDLHAGSYKRSGQEGKIVDEAPVVDIFLLESIRRKNCFSGPRVTDQIWTNFDRKRDGMSRGMWTHAAYANHSCLPNSTRSWIGDILITTATTDIPKGTEITHIYVAPRAVYAARKQQFTAWGFDCTCPLCSAEAKSSSENHAKRRKILAEIETLVKKRQPTKFQPDATMRPIEKLTRQLESLYEEDIYGNLPRLMLVWPTMWLLQAYHTRTNNPKTAKWAAAALRNFGFIEPVKDGMVSVFGKGKSGIVTYEVVKALKFSSDAYAATGDEDLSAQFREAAKTGYRIMSGFDDNFADREANPRSWL